MDIVKKNLLSIVCGVIALAAIVAWFWPVGGMFGSLQSDLDARAKTYQDVETLRTAQRKLPTVVLEGGASAEQAMLDRFPNEKVVELGRQKTKSLTEQSNRMLATVTKLNVRKPLLAGSLPQPSPSARTAFPQKYFLELGLTEKGFETGLPKRLSATRPPFPEELQEMAQKIWDEKYNPRVIVIGGDNNLDQVTEEFYAEVQDLPEREYQKRAAENRVYLDEMSLPVSPSPNMMPGKQPSDTDIWFAQTALWITEDVVNAINSANEGSKSIQDSAVKHLVALRVPFGPQQYVLATQAAGLPPGADGTAPVLPTDANGVAQVFNVSPTGRVSNDVYDVIHFEVVLRVDFRKIPQVIAELERNRLVTVLSTAVSGVDAEAAYRDVGYVYGNDPIAEVTFGCETLFLRSWTVDKDNQYKAALMPQPIRIMVGAEQGAAPVIPGDMGGEMMDPTMEL